MIARLAMAALMLLGCRRKPDSTPAQNDVPSAGVDGPPAALNIPWDTCDEAHAEAVERLLERQCYFAEAIAPMDLVTVDRAAAPVPSGLLEVEIQVGGHVRVDGFALAPSQVEDGLAPQVSDARQLAKIGGGSEPEGFALAIGANVDRARVRAALGDLHQAGLATGVVVFGSSEKVELPRAPKPSVVDALLTDIEAKSFSQKALFVGSRLDALVKDCSAAQKAFMKIMTTPQRRKCSELARRLPDAMIACGCGENEKELLSVLHVLRLGPSDGQLPSAVPVELDPQAKLTEGATWSDVVDTLDLNDAPIKLGTL